jgi:hypothetical protein
MCLIAIDRSRQPNLLRFKDLCASRELPSWTGSGRFAQRDLRRSSRSPESGYRRRIQPHPPEVTEVVGCHAQAALPEGTPPQPLRNLG